MAAQNHVISADSHMTEPATLWVDRLDEKFKDRAPKVIKQEGRAGYVFVAPGVPEFPVAGGFAAGRSGKELQEFLRANQEDGYDGARPGGMSLFARSDYRRWGRGLVSLTTLPGALTVRTLPFQR